MKIRVVFPSVLIGLGLLFTGYMEKVEQRIGTYEASIGRRWSFRIDQKRKLWPCGEGDLRKVATVNIPQGVRSITRGELITNKLYPSKIEAFLIQGLINAGE